MEGMRRRHGLAILAITACIAATPPSSVNQVIALVRSAIGSHESDKQLARALGKIEMGERLDSHAVEELESEGAGPKAVAELEKLREASRALPAPVAPAPFDSPPAPPGDEQRRILIEARRLALAYDKSLPDFICEQEIRRYHGERAGWGLKDTLTLRLSYFGQKEVYKLLTINGRPTVLPFEAVGGAISQGEFGSLLHEIFDRGTFSWDHWTNLRKRPALVYNFRVSPLDSHYRMDFASGSQRLSVVTGQHGVVYVDRETNSILRISTEADSIPRSFPVRSSSTLLDYEFTTVGGRPFLLPLRAQVRMATPDLRTRNDVVFRMYRKFEAETSISFGDPR